MTSEETHLENPLSPSFLDFPGKTNAGITTQAFEDMSLNSNYFQERMKRLKGILDCTNFFRLIPQHRKKVLREPQKEDRFKVDSLIKTKKDKSFVLISPTADSPVVTLEANNHIAGIVHSGREGIKLGVVPETIKTLRKKYNISPSEIKIGMWPGICENCYTVKEEQAQDFPQDFIRGNGQVFLDLKEALLDQLSQQGVLQDNISILHYCSAHSTDNNGNFIFRSLRRDNTPERDVVYITI